MAPEVWTVEQGALRVAGFRDNATVLTDEDKDEQVRISALLRAHLNAGKSIAYYVNNDLGHPDIGAVLAFTYGTPEAQFEPEQFPDGPPKQCPDGLARGITGGINWRYQLEAITPNLPDISDPQWDKPTTRIWVALDIAAEGPDGVVVVESILSEADEVIGWHIVNPANEDDWQEFREVAERLRTVFEEQGPMEELPFGQSVVPPESPAFTSPLGEHLIEQHEGYSPPYVATKIREGNEKHLVVQHHHLHEDPSAEHLPDNHNHASLRPEDL